MEEAGCSTQTSVSNFQSGVINERLLSMKRTRSGLIANVSRLQGELDVLLLDINNHKETAEKKNALDEAFVKCIQHCEKYFVEVPASDSFVDVKAEAKEKCVEAQSRKGACELNYEQYLQRCTDTHRSASVSSVTSVRTSSSIARRRKMIELQMEQREMELRLRLEQAKLELDADMAQARVNAQMELLKLEEVMSEGAKRIQPAILP